MPAAVLDTGKAWVERLIDLARLAQMVAVAALALVAVVGVLTVVFASRAGLAVPRPTIELLHILGASDAYIARQFQGHALWLGLRGGICGVLPAMAVLYSLGFAAERIEAPLLPELVIGLTGWFVLGLLPVVTDPETHAWLLANPWSEVAIDLEDCTLSFGAGSTTRFPMDSFARQCLLEGVDELGYLLAKVDVIEAFEAGR